VNTLTLILGNQLFSLDEHPLDKNSTIYMCEDLGLCTDIKHHKAKIALFFFAMRSYKESLLKHGYKVEYKDCFSDFSVSYIEKLQIYIKDNDIKKISFYEIEDKPFEEKLYKLIKTNNLDFEEIRSPMFLDTRESFQKFAKDKKFLLQGNYYKKNRREFNLLLSEGKPVGGKWSYDELNRLKLPKDYELPQLPSIPAPKDKEIVFSFIKEHFNDHPGNLKILMPYNSEQAKAWLIEFFNKRFNDFGPYEDAIVEDEHFLLHSVLSSSLNLGLLTPKYVVEEAIKYADVNKIPLNSLEGFIRQIIGWREFIRGVYQNYSNKMFNSNYWKHTRKMKDTWYEGTTGLPPVDNAIKGAQETGYTHHINRLMVLSNVMNMCQIHPDEIYKWFMEMFVDSSEWVMVPNVYGMGTFSDGGIFATKPYICGSSYMLRMSNFKKGDWCDAVDGLYWQFIETNREFFSSNPRLGLMIRSLDKINLDRKAKIYKAADTFRDMNTYV